MVNVYQGEVWWADLPEPVGSEPGFRRPIVIVQSDLFNTSRINTVLAVTLTRNIKRAAAPGTVFLAPRDTGLPDDSVANAAQLVTVDRRFLLERVGKLSRGKLALVFSAIDLVLGR